MLEYKKGDVLNGGEEVIVHGCNCFNTMGAGLASRIFTEAPFAWEADQRTERGDRSILGSYTLGIAKSGATIINAYTQYRFGSNGADVNYDALELVIRKVCLDFPNKVIAMPRIGCGLAGGDWSRVEAILVRVSEETGSTIRVYELP